MVPLSSAKASALRAAVRSNRPSLDDSFLSTVQAWMRKCTDNGLEGMVAILQQVLQFYAATVLIVDESVTEASEAKTSAALLDKVFATGSDGWDALLRESLTGDSPVCSSDVLLAEVQARIETVVLAQEAGSYSQRVQAEFLRELSERIRGMDGGAGGIATE